MTVDSRGDTMLEDTRGQAGSCCFYRSMALLAIRGGWMNGVICDTFFNLSSTTFDALT